jgi:hypothetical protein
MVWFLVDDVLPFHERVIRAGNAAMGLWVRGGAWCSGQLTDGFIPTEVARTMGTPAEIRKLVEVGLWHPEQREGQAGYLFHAWAEDGTGTKRQPTRAEVEAKRRAERERKAAYRERQRDDHRTTEPVPAGHPAGHRADTTRSSGVRPTPQAIPSQAIEEQTAIANAIAPSAEAEADRPSTDLVLIESPPPAPRSSRYPADFETFWAAYPRHEGKGDALKAWRSALQLASLGEIIAGARRYASDANREPSFTAHAATWLRRRGWEDEPLPERRPANRADRQRDAVGRMLQDLGAQVPGMRGA